MKKWILLVAIVCIGFHSLSLTAGEREYYQVKMYKIASDYQESLLDQYLESAYLPALHKAGIKKVGVFKPIEGKNDSARFIMVFIPFGSLQEFEALDGKLKLDREYQKAGKAYISGHRVRGKVFPSISLPRQDPLHQHIQAGRNHN